MAYRGQSTELLRVRPLFCNHVLPVLVLLGLEEVMFLSNGSNPSQSVSRLPRLTVATFQAADVTFHGPTFLVEPRRGEVRSRFDTVTGHEGVK